VSPGGRICNDMPRNIRVSSLTKGEV
jgi:hypothetical protein